MSLESELRDAIVQAVLDCEAAGLDDDAAWDEANERVWHAARHLHLARRLAARVRAWKALAKSYRERLRPVARGAARPRASGVPGRPRVVYDHALVRDALRGRTLRGAARYLGVPQATLILYVCRNESAIFANVAIDWDAQPLGEESDTEVARRLGVTQRMVRSEREARQIPRRRH